MNLAEIWQLWPKLSPLLPRIEKAIATTQRLMNDPDVKDALAVAGEVSAIVEQVQKGK